MDPIQQEDPDAKPKRLVVLAGAGMVVATGFATIAVMVLSSQHHDGASSDASLPPTSSTDQPASTNLSYRLPPTDRLARTTSSQPGGPLTDPASTTSSSSVPGESSPDGPPMPPDSGDPSPTNPEPTSSPPDLPGPTDPPSPPEPTEPNPPEPTQPPSSSHPTPPTTTSTETTGYSAPPGSSA